MDVNTKHNFLHISTPPNCQSLVIKRYNEQFAVPFLATACGHTMCSPAIKKTWLDFLSLLILVYPGIALVENGMNRGPMDCDVPH